MGLIKEKLAQNGVPLIYHRVVAVNNITNISSDIEVASYTSVEQREKEKTYQLTQLKNLREEELTEEEQEILTNGINVYIDTSYYHMPYDKDLNVDNAYEYIKGLEEFEGAEDV